MSGDAFQRAERCFALARSTTFSGERETAIAKGTAIAAKAGLSLDHFDIPGRARTGPRRERLFEGNGIFGPSGYRYGVHVDSFDAAETAFAAAMDVHFAGDAEAFASALAKLKEALDRQSSEVTRERERRRKADMRLRDALNFLWARGVRIHRNDKGEFWSEDHLDPDATFGENEVLAAAESRGWKR